ncbi:BREX-2 system adenine-specific DNA-methyltransferase PglX [Plantactinospora sp. WMMB334]|uniref:BREX-2 system adenine-specific DNA-methyltransferase PglX n=1 Tax=Plantactinospora sp. WMMB334 TaxID=3404119 RepID=UPI003B955669
MIELRALQGQVRNLVDDLRKQVAGAPELRAELRAEHGKAKDAQRTAGTFETWLEDILDQAAVAWVLGCVFVRFCEDNDLFSKDPELGERLWIGGDDPAAPAERAIERRQAYLVENSRKNDRDWLREAFEYLAGLRATGKLFDKHNQVWRFDISGEAAEGLSDFFRRGAGRVSLRRPELDTRFLGDLYQDLSAHAKKTYALLQTPDFVEEFILDRTFEPAVKEFGLAETKVIDPTCGSGHFLLGAFDRLIRRWKEREPNTDIRVLIERALGQVTGVDINPFAVAIARFRLLIAAMKEAQHFELETTPSWPVRVATGDSLLPWGEPGRGIQGDMLAMLEGREIFAYDSEDADLLKDYLKPNQYTVVVGNPPYITVADSARNQLYRDLYPSVCHRQYALTVPFAKRFFELARHSDDFGDASGYVGQITGNGFMKREFGKRLVENYFANVVELIEVIDASGAFIPGHGTPTVILVGRMNQRRRAATVRALLGGRGETSQPDEPGKGFVWRAILDQVDRPGSESPWMTALEIQREKLASHPWSLSGGGAVGLREEIEAIGPRLAQLVELPVGRAIRAGADEAFVRPAGRRLRTKADRAALKTLVVGEVVRDWQLAPTEDIWYPYDEQVGERGLVDELWQWRHFLQERRTFQGNMADAGLRWWEYMQHTASAYRSPLSIVFAFVATHNQFVLDRGGKIFKQSALVIKLPEGAVEDDHLRLLGVLNSSTACFWLKQVSQPKGGTANSSGGGNRWSPEPWYERYEFTGTKLQEFPLPGAYPLERARELDSLAQRLVSLTPAAIAGSGVPTRERLAEAREEYNAVRARMIAVQEELDWEVYRLYGLLTEDLNCDDPPGLNLGERAFEMVMAIDNVQTEWFTRHGSQRRDKPHNEWPVEYQRLVERRIEAIRSNQHIGLIERPECKRRWSSKPWEDLQREALRDWLLDRLEAPELWGGTPEPLSVAQLADRVRHDKDFRSVLDLWIGHDDYNLSKTIGTLVADEHVPYLPAQRYKPSGLRKRAQWERTWALQRREDTGEKVEIDVPPKYASADFVRASYWKARGKLDVPKERFISYPGASRDTDGSELLGWAGWDHLAQAQALAMVYLDRKAQELWPEERLLPLLAGLMELEPWLHQWHAVEQPGYPGSPAQFYTDFLDTELSELGSDRSILGLLRGLSNA